MIVQALTSLRVNFTNRLYIPFFSPCRVW